MSIESLGGWAGVLGRLADGHELSATHSRQLLTEVFAGGASDAQLAALIVGLRLRGETAEELLGFSDALLDAAVPLELAGDEIDIVGTGGAPSRRRHALNVSTMSSLVAAASGARVAKHGNVRASATSGSFDLLAALGVVGDLGPEAVQQCLEECGVGFVFARRYHPAMATVGPVRAQLGIPTVFNLLGPLSHPGRVRRMVLGVADPRAQADMARVLAARQVERAWVVHGDGGLDELSTTGPSRVIEVTGSEISEFELDPRQLGITPARPEQLAGGSPDDNTAIARRVLAGETGPAADIVALNAAAGLLVAREVDSIEAGLERCRQTMAEGEPLILLDRVARLTHRLAGEQHG